jgi:glycopeptide antibiotics resistance protein
MRPVATLLLALWLIGGLVLTLQPAYPLPGQVVDDNLVPFHTLAIYWRNLGSEFWMRNLFGNLALLLPLGLLGPIALPALDRWWRIALVALLYSVAIEVIQLAVPDRSADIDDVIVNVAGALLGYVAWRAWRR